MTNIIGVKNIMIVAKWVCHIIHETDLPDLKKEGIQERGEKIWNG